MNCRERLKRELKAMTLATLYFGAWIGALLVIKHLVLAEYGIPFHRWSMALVGAMVLSKVVLVLEHFPLGARVRAGPTWVHVVLRTALYSVGVFVVLVLEKTLAGWQAHGSLIRSMTAGFQQAQLHHVMANVICLSGALLGYNLLAMIRQHLGEGALLRLLLSPLPDNRGGRQPPALRRQPLPTDR